jgi:hypothetical protein
MLQVGATGGGGGEEEEEEEGRLKHDRFLPSPSQLQIYQ